jgi:polyketide synthase PksN
MANSVRLVTEQLYDKALHYFKRLLSTVLKLSIDRVDAAAPFEQYGVDSVMALRLTDELEKGFGLLPKTLFFEHQSIDALTRYFQRAHDVRLRSVLGINKQAASIPASAAKNSVLPRFAVRAHSAMKALRPAAVSEDVAIIGLSGRYPEARTVEEFWENLKAGRDSITEIPAERWDHRRYFDTQKGKFGKSYSKWGGFIDGFAEFDPLFFNIPPRDALIMDPQERVFMQCVYEVMEDAGYTRESIGAGADANVGVFVGVMYDEY